MPLHTRILVGLVVGAVSGVVCQWLFGESPLLADFTTYVSEPFGRLFLRLIFMIVLPLLFSALALGVAGLGDLGTLGRIGRKTFLYSLAVTSASVILGLSLVNFFQPGASLDPETRATLQQSMPTPVPPPTSLTENPVLRILYAIVPDNPLRAAAQGEMLAFMFFSLMVGIGIALSPVEKVAPLVQVLEGLYEVVMRLIELAMRLAPYGVAALLFTLTARFGLAVLKPLLGYMGVVLGGLGIHLFVTYSLLVRYLGGMSPPVFFRAVSEVMATAFSTSSSNATLPTALRVTQEKLGVPRDIASFVLTLGSTANQNGTALFEGVTILFLAQFYGVDLTFGSQVVVILFSVLAGIGTAGVPGGSLPMMVPLLQSVGIPGEGIGIILGVDRILDMSRTVLNVTGDITAAVYVAHSEGRMPKTTL
ncbi:MAG: dicarboxylate/amino acid:cation symporter [Deltaproteobacteria bacterium]|nr:dicarboxylate/amino acid:cation symporter [Deltaproteobacteria bacterium]